MRRVSAGAAICALCREAVRLWDRRKVFVARYNRVARLLVAEDGSYPHMTGEGDIVRRLRGPTRKAPGRTPRSH